MAELRRVLIDQQRLRGCGHELELTSQERHYLEKVLRLRRVAFAIVDGQGCRQADYAATAGLNRGNAWSSSHAKSQSSCC